MATSKKNVLVTIQFVSKVERLVHSMDAASKKFNEVQRAIKETNDKLAIVSKKLDGVGKTAKSTGANIQATAKNAKALSDEALQASAKLITLTQKMQAASVRAQNLARSAQVAAVGADKIQTEFRRATSAADALSREAADVANRIGVLSRKLSEGGDRSGKLRREIEVLSKRAERLSSEANKTNLRVESLGNSAKQAGIKAQTLGANANQAMRQVTRLGTQMRIAEVTARNLGVNTTVAAKAVDTYSNEAKDATQQSHTYAGSIQGVAQAAQAAAQKVQQLTQSVQQSAQTVKQATGGAGGGAGGGGFNTILAGFAGGVGAGALGLAGNALTQFAGFVKNIAGGLISTLGKMVMAPVNFVTTVTGLSFKAVGMLGKSLAIIPAALNATSMAFGGASNAILGFTQTVSEAIYLVGNMFSAVRQLGQGLQTFAYLLTAVVTVPVGGFLSFAAKSAMDLDHGLTEVRKTANLTNPELKKLKENLLEISLTTPTDVIDLTAIATEWGRAGAKGVDEISKLVQVSDMLVISSDLTADEVVKSIGRIGNIFYGSIDDTVQYAEAMGSAINDLADANVISEAELVATTLRASPMAKMLGLTLQETLALSATAASTNASAERAGTQLNAALAKTAVNVEKIAIATGMSEQAIKDMADENPARLFMSILEGTSGLVSNTERVQLVTEIFGETGGKAVANLASGYDLLNKNIAISNESFDRATSLQLVYLAALDSTQNQLNIVKNNFKYLAITVGDTLLPIFTKLFAAVIPGIQMIAEGFKSLTPQVQFTIVAVAALAAALGPVVLALGSMMFSIGIIGTGLVAFANMITGVIGRMIAGIFGLISIFTSPAILLAGITATMTIIIARMSKLGGSIKDVFNDLIASAYNWGYNLIATFSNGIMNATSATVRAVKSIALTIAGFLQSFSPPKEGPLKEIDTWGYNLGTTFAEAFAEADIDGVIQFTRNFGSAIRDVISNFSAANLDRFDEFLSMGSGIVSAFGGVLGLDSNVIAVRVNEFARKLASIFSGIGEGVTDVSGIFSSLGDYIGSFAGDFEKLLGLQLRYNAANEELIRLKERLEDFDKETIRRIENVAGRTDMTGLQRAAAIRQIRYEAEREKEALEEQVKQREKDVKGIEDQISAQKQFISIMQSLIPSGSPLKPEKEKDPEDYAGTLPIDPNQAAKDAQDAADEINDALNRVGTGTIDFISRIDLARERINGFFFALRSGVPDWKNIDQYSKEWMEGFQAGGKVRDIFLEWWFDVRDILIDVYDYAKRIHDAFSFIWKGIQAGWTGDDTFLSELADDKTIDSLRVIENILASIGKYLGQSAKGVADFIAGVATSASLDPRVLPPILDAIQTGKPIIKAINFTGIGEFIAEKINEYVLSNLSTVDTSPFITTIKNVFSVITGFISGIDMDALTTAIASVPNAIIESLQKISEDGTLDGALGNITKGIVMLLDKIDFTGAVEVIGNIAEKISQALADVDWQKFTNVFTAVAEAMTKVLANLPWEQFSEIFSTIANAILTNLARPEIWNNLHTTFQNIVDMLADFLDETDFYKLGESLSSGINTVISGIDWTVILKSAFGGLGDAINGLFTDVLVNALNKINPLAGLGYGYYKNDEGSIVSGYNPAVAEQAGQSGITGPVELPQTQRNSFLDYIFSFSPFSDTKRKEEIEKQAQENIGPAFASGVSKYLETDTQVSTATEQALMRMANNVPLMSRTGSAVSTSFFGQFASSFLNTASTETEHFDSVMDGFDLWTSQNTASFNKSARGFVGALGKEIFNELSGAYVMFDGIIIAMNEWFALATTPIVNAFTGLGNKITLAIGSGIVANKDALWDSIEDLFTPPVIPPARSSGFVNPSMVPVDTSLVGASVGASSVFNINVNVNGNGQNGDLLGQQIARAVEQELSRKLRLTGNYKSNY